MHNDISKDRSYEIWKNAEVSNTFLEGVRGAIPLATEQIDVLLRIINLTQTEVKSFLDLGCGNGILGGVIHQQYSDAKGIFVDISESMMQSAQSNPLLQKDKSTFIREDFGHNKWMQSVIQLAPFDVIVSGFAIHHQPDNRKIEIYREIYELLKPGGLFLNLEHIASRSKLGENAFDQLFVDSLYSFHQKQNSSKSREEIDHQYYNRSDKNANILTLVETQCDWLRNIGFIEVDCFMKLFEIAIFGGLR